MPSWPTPNTDTAFSAGSCAISEPGTLDSPEATRPTIRGARAANACASPAWGSTCTQKRVAKAFMENGWSPFKARMSGSGTGEA